jgi:hypothetical protein
MSENELEVKNMQTNDLNACKSDTSSLDESSHDNLNHAKKSVRFESSSNDDEVFLLSKVTEGESLKCDDDGDENEILSPSENVPPSTSIRLKHKEATNSKFLGCFKPPAHAAKDGPIQHQKHLFNLGRYKKSPNSIKKEFRNANGRSKSSLSSTKVNQSEVNGNSKSLIDNHPSTPNLVTNVIKFFRLFRNSSVTKNVSYEDFDKNDSVENK